jgi:hypothetical protein
MDDSGIEPAEEEEEEEEKEKQIGQGAVFFLYTTLYNIY